MSADPLLSQQPPSTGEDLNKEEKAFFHEFGFLKFEHFLAEDHIRRLCEAVDRRVEDQEHKRAQVPVAYEALGLLSCYGPLMTKLTALMNGPFSMHHLHATRQDAGSRGAPWHQDYEQVPNTNRSHLMVHVFFYLHGLNGEIGDLLFVPKSQHSVVSNSALNIFGTDDLPGTVVVDDLPPGSILILHSALFHARRPKPGGENNPRYFVDISYCQHGIKWPSSYQTEKAYAAAKAMGLDQKTDNPHLYDRDQFFDYKVVWENFKARNQGSIAYQLDGNA